MLSLVRSPLGMISGLICIAGFIGMVIGIFNQDQNASNHDLVASIASSWLGKMFLIFVAVLGFLSCVPFDLLVRMNGNQCPISKMPNGDYCYYAVVTSQTQKSYTAPVAISKSDGDVCCYRLYFANRPVYVYYEQLSSNGIGSVTAQADEREYKVALTDKLTEVSGYEHSGVEKSVSNSLLEVIGMVGAVYLLHLVIHSGKKQNDNVNEVDKYTVYDAPRQISNVTPPEDNGETDFAKGCSYYLGDGVEQDFLKAYYWLDKAANKNHQYAQYLLYLMLVDGLGINKDINKAIYWLKKSADSGFHEAENTLGVHLLNGVGLPCDKKEAVEWFKRAAEQNDADALYNLALEYYSGEILKQDYTQAASLFREAVDKGNDVAIAYLADCYRFGRGVNKDEKAASEWYLKAAECGDKYAQFVVGQYCRTGNILDKDLNKAMHWIELSANNGYPDAEYQMGTFYDAGGLVEQSDEKAFEFYAKAAAHGHTEAQFETGYMYDNGIGTSQDKAKAAMWYEKAAEKGHVTAQFDLALLYENGDGIPKDIEKARYWYEKAAAQGDEDAENNLLVLDYNASVDEEENT